MVIALIGTTTNIILDFILVHGISGLITPMYLKGAALASVISQFLMALLSTFLIISKTKIDLIIRPH